MKKVFVVFGTRPEAIKMAPLVKELQTRKNIKCVVCVTAQHRQMLDQVFKAFDIIPDYDLNIMKPGQSLSDITTLALRGLEEVLINDRPDMILVHGDTMTTLAGSLAAFYHQINIGHVEAGLRTWNKYSPFPEEIIRQAVDCIADMYFVPTTQSKKNLMIENKPEEKIYITGNTVIDALKTTVVKNYKHPLMDWCEGSRLILLTAHRRENLGEPMQRIFRAVKRIVDEFTDVKVIYPVHMNPAVQKVANEILENNDRIRLIEPLEVFEFHNFMNKSYIILTDSGGVQEEAPSLGKPVLVLRDTTERPEGIDAGTLKLVGTDENSVYANTKELLCNLDLYDKMSRASNPYGDGKASKRIADAIENFFASEDDVNNYHNLSLTEKGLAEASRYEVKNAIILAAGFGSRFVPLTLETPKGLLKVHGQPMIERQIEQLQNKGITNITIVVGYKKESFDYLVDKYGVTTIYNAEYSTKNNLASLHCVSHLLDSTYVLMSDFWIEENIFNAYEACSWYSGVYLHGQTNEWCVTTSPSGRIKSISIGGSDSYALVGPAYFTPSFSEKFKELLAEYYNKPGTDDYFWEQVLINNINSLTIYLNEQTGNVYEFENFEELKMFDPSYNNASKSKIMESIVKCFNTSEDKIHNIQQIKQGMTNRSFKFEHDNTTYIMRIPGEGTDKMINRRAEYKNYMAVSKHKISDELIYFDPESGYKITLFLNEAKTCDPLHIPSVKACMKKLRMFHELKLQVEHSFCPFERIEFYESLWTSESCFCDYSKTKANIIKLKDYLDSIAKDWTMCHIDAVPDNFIFKDETNIIMLDWEYSGMQDPHIDIAMFSVYSGYNKSQVDDLIGYYFPEGFRDDIRTKIYAYIAVCGLLWSNWCEYKRQLGVEFGNYALVQYRYAKDFYRIFKENTNGGV